MPTGDPWIAFLLKQSTTFDKTEYHFKMLLMHNVQDNNMIFFLIPLTFSCNSLNSL